MTTYPSTFSIDHLLMNGFVCDRGQVSPSRRAALDKRVFQGKLIRERWIDRTTREDFAVWRVPGFEVTERMISS